MTLNKNAYILYNYLFHYNEYTNIWSAFTRDNYTKYFNGELKDEDIYKSKNIMTLINVLMKKRRESVKRIE